MLLLGPLAGGELASVTLTLDAGRLGLAAQDLAFSSETVLALDAGTLGLTPQDVTVTALTTLTLAPGALGLTGVDLGTPQSVTLAPSPLLGLRGATLRILTGGNMLEPDVAVGSWADGEMGRWLADAITDYRGTATFVHDTPSEWYKAFLTAITAYDEAGGPPYPWVAPELARWFLDYLRHFGAGEGSTPPPEPTPGADTLAKRASASTPLCPWQRLPLVPTGTVDAAERRAALTLYSGV